MKKQLTGKLYKLDEKDKWQAVVHTGYNPEKKRYDKVRRTFYGTKRQAEAFLRDLIFELENPEVIASEILISEWLDYWLINYGAVIYKWVVLDAKQLSEFLEESKDHRDYAIVYTAAYTGARQSELLGLTWDKVNWDEKTITIDHALHLDDESEDGFEHRPRTKNETSTRTIDVSERVLKVLQEYKKSQIDSPLVFTEPNGDPINRHNLTHRFSNLVKRLGYPIMTFHHLRHTHATILLSDGAYINEVANRLGHADPKITFSIYGHVLPNKKQTLANRFDELLG